MADALRPLSIGTLSVGASSRSEGTDIAAEFERIAAAAPLGRDAASRFELARLSVVRAPGESAAEAAMRGVREHFAGAAHG